MSETEPLDPAALLAERSALVLLVGMGVTNKAVARALLRRGHEVLAVDDNAVALGDDLDIDLVVAPTGDELKRLVNDVDLIIPTPGLPEQHAVFGLCAQQGAVIVSEFDLAQAWDERPIGAITGTNGKTTVVELAVAALEASGVRAVAAGNTDIPLVEAIDDPLIDVFIVEASSFRLAHSRNFTPMVATWINFSPDHLDVHRTLEDYETAKASIWAQLPPDGHVVANAADEVVMRNVPPMRPLHTFGTNESHWRYTEGKIVGPDGISIDGSVLTRRLPHDIEDALAAAATAALLGATEAGLAKAFSEFVGLAHRVEFVDEVDGVAFYDDSKATTPHATIAAVRGFDRVVLIAGGRNKGIDLSGFATVASRLAGVVAIGEAADEVAAAFAATEVRIERAKDMKDAVDKARQIAGQATPVLLSPGCASFDWYRSYGERGDDFQNMVRALVRPAGEGTKL